MPKINLILHNKSVVLQQKPCIINLSTRNNKPRGIQTMYILRKISVNSYNVDGSVVYESEYDVGSFKDLIKFIQRNDQFVTDGKGADVFVNDEWFCHTDELFYQLGDESLLTLHRFKQTWEQFVKVRAYELGASMCLEFTERNIEEVKQSINRTLREPRNFVYAVVGEFGDDGDDVQWGEL